MSKCEKTSLPKTLVNVTTNVFDGNTPPDFVSSFEVELLGVCLPLCIPMQHCCATKRVKTNVDQLSFHSKSRMTLSFKFN